MSRCPAALCVVIALTLLTVLLPGCSSDTRSSSGSLEVSGNTGGSRSEELPAALPKLPAPSAALGQLRRSSAQTLSVNGADFEAALPSQNITADGAMAVFDPDWAKQDLNDNADLAYAVYRLNLEGWDVAPKLRLLFGTAGIERSNLWIGLGNWDSQRWEWQRMPSVTKAQELDLSAYIGPGSDVLVSVVMLGVIPHKLALLTVLPTDEVEPNDSMETAQALPGSAVSGFRGDVGALDSADYFAFPGSSATHVRGSLRFDSSAAAMKVTLLNAQGEILEDSESFGSDYLSFIDSWFTPLEASEFPLILKVEATSGVSQYDLSFGLGVLPDVPDFTYFLQADPQFGALPFEVNFSSTIADTPEVFYQWDLNDDFVIDAITETPFLTWTYTENGLFDARMIMKHVNGADSELNVLVGAGDIGWDEREDNDNENDANLLDPGLAESGFRGNVGGQGEYDGDLEDWVSLELDPGQSAIFTLENAGDPEGLLEINGPNMTGLPGDPLQAFNPPILSRKAYEYSIYGNCGDYRLKWVYGFPPELDLTNDPLPGGGPAPYTLELTAAASDPDGGSITAIKWDIDEDGVADYTGENLSHVFETQGDKIITVYAYDDQGFRSALEYNIYVEPSMP
ncbi:hypothetical protein IT575_01515 [bacterium]|nr:hypothetical protein [bacterium]